LQVLDQRMGTSELPQAHFVGEDAPTFTETSQRKDYRIDLMRIRINARLPLRRGISLQVVGSTDANEVLGKNPLVEWVECCHWRSYW
jgi:hypothetical protein